MCTANNITYMTLKNNRSIDLHVHSIFTTYLFNKSNFYNNSCVLIGLEMIQRQIEPLHYEFNSFFQTEFSIEKSTWTFCNRINNGKLVNKIWTSNMNFHIEKGK